MYWYKKPTPEFWRIVVLTMLIGFAAGVLGAVVAWSRLVAYETSLSVGNQPTPFASSRRGAAREREATEAIMAVGARSVVSFFDEKTEPEARYYSEEALGQGMVFTSDGWIISHRSSIDPRRRATLRAGVGSLLLPIEKIVEDTETGVLFLKVAALRLDPLEFASGVGEAGERVHAVLPPHELALTSVRNARSRATSRAASDELQAMMTLGESFSGELAGGPIWNEAGQVTGIAVRDGGVVEKAIPIAQVQPLFSLLLDGKLLERPALGVHGVALADSWNGTGTRERGFLLTRDAVTGARAVVAGGSGARAGLLADDVILKLNDVVLNGLVDVAEVLLAFRPGEELDLTIVRNGDEMVLPVTLGSRLVGRTYE